MIQLAAVLGQLGPLEVQTGSPRGAYKTIQPDSRQYETVCKSTILLPLPFSPANTTIKSLVGMSKTSLLIIYRASLLDPALAELSVRTRPIVCCRMTLAGAPDEDN